MLMIFGFLDLGAPQLLIILTIVLLLFGSKKLPELSRSLGESIHEMKKSASDADNIRKDVKKQVTEVKNGLADVKADITGKDRRV